MRLLLAVSIGALAVAGAACGATSHEPAGDDAPPEPPPCGGDSAWCCEPDHCTCECPAYWQCTEFEGALHCVQQDPDLPSAGSWDCRYEIAEIVCTAAAEELDRVWDGPWDCNPTGDGVECRKAIEDDDMPAPEGRWDCAYDAGGLVRRCEQRDSSPEPWECEELADGRLVCRQYGGDPPDAGQWDCYRVDGSDFCVSDHMPEGDASEWECQSNAELVLCERSPGRTPGEGGPWQCAWGPDFIECEEPSPEDPPGCACPLGGVRFCDEPTFGNWGTQECIDRGSGRRWDRCDETEILEGCEPGGAAARDYEWHYRGGFWDGQVYDPNDDGVLLMPPDNWYNPAAQDCAMRLGWCVQDMWDLDVDGDNQESAGTCAPIDECAEGPAGG